MSKILTLKDGTTHEMEDNSSVGALVFKVDNFAAVDTLKAALTTDNLSEISIGVNNFTDVAVDHVNIMTDDNGDITATFLCRMSTNDIVDDAIDAYTTQLIDGGIL